MRKCLALALVCVGGLACFGHSALADSSIGLVTGPHTGTYIAVGRDIAVVAGAVGTEVEVKPSGGSIDNIKRINSKENAALGIMQSDVLGFLSRSRNPETMRIASRLRVVLPLYKEEVHVLARKEIRDFKDLQGKNVVVGEEGSGNMLTAVNLLSMLEIKVGDALKLSPPEGVVAVLQKEADAVIFVGGSPIRLFKNLEDLKTKESAKFAPLLKDVHFLPMTDPRMLEEYLPATIEPADYNFVDEAVPTLAVTAYLVTFDFHDADTKKGKRRCKQIGNVAKAVRENIDKLRETGHPKWKQVDLSAPMENWKKDRCSWQAEDR